MGASEIGGRELFVDELHEIRDLGRVVWCRVSVPERTPPASGAAAARRVGDYLISHVLQRRSPWLGLVLDVRRGPSVFGPITRAVTVRLLESAEQAHKPFAVLTAGNTTSTCSTPRWPGRMRRATAWSPRTRSRPTTG
ncbi:MAG TPA: hypothetical protein VFS67_30295 [Polyangiaceae bacterium]|nr:hypothetical protein [Polyangiaceae bacterium]